MTCLLKKVKHAEKSSKENRYIIRISLSINRKSVKLNIPKLTTLCTI